MKFKIITEDIDDISQSEQEFTSAKTSINGSKLPVVFKLVDFKSDTINLDYGGGKFDNATEYLKQQNVTNLIYDPFNRSDEHNKEVLKTIKQNGGADTATLSNVLNVIKEESIRNEVLNNIKKLLKPSGTCYITVYEGNESNTGSQTSSGYQLNRKTVDYLDEVKEVFPNIIRKGKLIIAR